MGREFFEAMPEKNPVREKSELSGKERRRNIDARNFEVGGGEGHGRGNSVERRERPIIRIIIVGKGLVARHLQEVLIMLAGDVIQTELFDPQQSITEKIKEFSADVVLMLGDEKISDDDAIRIVTEIRNNPAVEKQPLVMALGFPEQRAKNLVNAGVDVGIDTREMGIDAIFRQLGSLSDLLDRLEDQYGDTMLKNKQGFYKWFRDELIDRAEVTADTEKEVAILSNIFRSHGGIRKVLDAGGGSGRIAIPLAENGYKLTNTDSTLELLEQMRNKTNDIPGVQADLRHLPIKDEQFDAVTFNWHVFCDILGNKNKRQALAEARRVLTEGGLVILDLPDREKSEYRKDGVYLQRPSNKDELVFVGYIPTSDEMSIFLEKAGFENIQIKHWQTKKGYRKVTFTAEKPKM